MNDDKNAPTPKPAPTDTTVINPEARLVSLGYYTDEPAAAIKDGNGNEVVRPRRYAVSRALPGLNYVSTDVLERAGLKGGDHSTLRIGEDLARLPPATAKDLAAKSSSAPALRRWLKEEKRPDVRAEIEKRLATRLVKEAA
jgi:hypothetical protein